MICNGISPSNTQYEVGEGVVVRSPTTSQPKGETRPRSFIYHGQHSGLSFSSLVQASYSNANVVLSDRGDI